MKKKSTILGIVAVLAVILLVLTGCGDSDTDSSNKKPKKEDKSSSNYDTVKNSNETNTLDNKSKELANKTSEASKSDEEKLKTQKSQIDDIEEMINSNNSNLDKKEINAFNAQFEKYEGNMRGSSVKDMIGQAISNNTSNSKHQVKIIYENESKVSDTTDLGKMRSKILNSKTYDVTCEKDSDGYISEINIKAK